MSALPHPSSLQKLPKIFKPLVLSHSLSHYLQLSLYFIWICEVGEQLGVFFISFFYKYKPKKCDMHLH